MESHDIGKRCCPIWSGERSLRGYFLQLDGKTIVQWSPRKHVVFGGASGSMGHLLVQSSLYDHHMILL